MTIKNSSIVFSISFENKVSIKDLIIFFNNLFLDYSDKQFDELTYTITDKSKVNWKQKNKVSKYNSKNLEKFYDDINKNQSSLSFEILKLSKDCKYKYIDIDFSISLYEQEGETPFSINVILDYEQYKETLLFFENKFFLNILNFLNTQSVGIVYGFISIVEKSKSPSFYIQGILSEELSKKEEEFLSVWSNNKDKCKYYIWDLFLGNIISKNHLKSNSFTSVTQILSLNQILNFSEELYFISLNNGNNELDKSLKNKIKSYFNSLY